MEETQQEYGLYSPSQVGKCSNIGHKIVVFRKKCYKSEKWDLDPLEYMIWNSHEELEVKQITLANINRSPQVNMTQISPNPIA